MDQQKVKNTKKDIEGKEDSPSPTLDSMFGKPWKIIAECESYEDACKKKGEALEKSPFANAKIRRTSRNTFVVKLRALVDAQTKKASKKKKKPPKKKKTFSL